MNVEDLCLSERIIAVILYCMCSTSKYEQESRNKLRGYRNIRETKCSAVREDNTGKYT